MSTGSNATAPPRPSRRSLLLRFVPYLVSFLVTALIMEVGAWLFITKVAGSTGPRGRPEKIFDAYREYRLAPGYDNGWVVANGQGFRRREDVVRDKPDGTYRIFLMGGSAAFGASVTPPFPPFRIANEDTIAYKLEESLRDEVPGLNFEVINAALGGYRTHNHLVYLNQELLDYDPDMVIFMDGHNDHYNSSPDVPQFRAIFRGVHDLNDPSLGFAFEVAVRSFAQKSWFFHGVHTVLRRLRSWERDPANRAQGDLGDYEEVARSTFLKIIKRNVMILQDEGVVPLVFLQPELILQPPDTLSAEDSELLEIELSIRSPGYGVKMEEMYRKLIPLMTELSEQYEFEFHDLNPVFHPVLEQCFIDFAHLSPLGAGVVAERMKDEVLDKLQPDRLIDTEGASSGAAILR